MRPGSGSLTGWQWRVQVLAGGGLVLSARDSGGVRGGTVPEGRGDLLRQARSLLAADLVLFVELGLLAGDPVVARWECVGEESTREALALGSALTFFAGRGASASATAGDGRLATVLRGLATSDESAGERLWRAFFEGRADVVASRLSLEDQSLGWLLALRTSGRWVPNQRTGLRAFGARHAQAFHRAAKAERAALPRRAVGLLFTPVGGLELASTEAVPALWAAHLVSALGDIVAALEAAGESLLRGAVGYGCVEVQRLEAGAHRRYVVLFGGSVSPLPASASALSPAQHRVAELAAAGATVAEVAESLGMACGTVRTHLGRVYERLSVSTRLELARALGAPFTPAL